MCCTDKACKLDICSAKPLAGHSTHVYFIKTFITKIEAELEDTFHHEIMWFLAPDKNLGNQKKEKNDWRCSTKKILVAFVNQSKQLNILDKKDFNDQKSKWCIFHCHWKLKSLFSHSQKFLLPKISWGLKWNFLRSRCRLKLVLSQASLLGFVVENKWCYTYTLNLLRDLYGAN